MLSARAASGGQGSGLWRCWRVNETGRSCAGRGGSPKYEVLRSDQKVSESDHLGLQRVWRCLLSCEASAGAPGPRHSFLPNRVRPLLAP